MNATRWIMIVALAAALTAPAMAQKVSLELAGADLAAKATETVEITLDGELLRLASRFLASDKDPEAAEVARLVNRLQGIYVRTYTFAEPGAYDASAVQQVRSRVGAGWQKIVNVKSLEENVEIFTQVKGDEISGLMIIAAEPLELTFVNIVGPIDLAQLSKLEGQFGIPRLPQSGQAKE